MDHEHHHADKNIQFLVLEFKDKVFDPKSFEEKVAYLLWEHPNDANVIRIKGIFPVSTSELKYSLQG